MPSATPELRKEWDDQKAMHFLKSRGYVLTSDWVWKLPKKKKKPSSKEFRAIVYLIQEWDFGGLLDTNPSP